MDPKKAGKFISSTKNNNVMAKMDEGIFISGTIGNLTFYQMYGRTYMRTKSSLTRKRVLKSKEFEQTRKHASDLGRAAQIGSVVYQALPAEMKERWLYRAITGEAASLLYEGQEEDEVQEFLWKKYIEDTGVEKEAVITPEGSYPSHSSKETSKKLWEIFCKRWEMQGRSYYHFKRHGKKEVILTRKNSAIILTYWIDRGISGLLHLKRQIPFKKISLHYSGQERHGPTPV